MIDLIQRIAQELSVRPLQVQSAVTLLDEGATVPFIARYRKEATDGLDDTQLRNLEERLGYLRELEVRRLAVLKSIEEQGKMTPELNASIMGADTKTRLEDLYAPFKQKRRTKAQIAREAGIEPLLDALLGDAGLDPDTRAMEFINAECGFEDSSAVLEGARWIFMERVAEDADLVGSLRDHAWDTGLMVAAVIEGQQQPGAKFSDYFAFSEPLHKIPSHRALAMFRGSAEGVLSVKLSVPGQDDLESISDIGHCESRIAARFGIRDQARPADGWLKTSVRWAWRVKLHGQLERELFLRLRESAEEEAIRVFGENLRDLLLAAPAGPRATLGLDPGLRTGVKVVVINATGALVAHETIFPHAPRNQWDAAIETLAALVRKHQVELISIGNGTASRETDRLVKDLAKRYPDLRTSSIVVSEAGASIYSASEFAAREFPDLDVTLRGAVSIARRLQDPLAELVKIEPKAIGVGQYQHDLNQVRLARKLDAVVEDCVNAVGVEMNTASVPLLARVAGLSESLASNIVAFRDQHGPFRNRKQLLEVSRLGPKAFEQAAGFLRVMNGDNPLDASAVHPESYPVVERILSKTGLGIHELVGNSTFLKNLAANDYVDERFGEPTIRDIIVELDKPGRDPRPEFKTASFKDGVEKIADLTAGMILEGVVTNVANFGAFVDIGVHQDGLVHISMLAEKFVKDPRDVVKAGDVVKVKVLEIDPQRKRISLTMRLADPIDPSKEARDQPGKPVATAQRQPKRRSEPQPQGAMAEAFARLKKTS
jgi:uncharacterized protein